MPERPFMGRPPEAAQPDSRENKFAKNLFYAGILAAATEACGGISAHERAKSIHDGENTVNHWVDKFNDPATAENEGETITRYMVGANAVESESASRETLEDRRKGPHTKITLEGFKLPIGAPIHIAEDGELVGVPSRIGDETAMEMSKGLMTMRIIEATMHNLPPTWNSRHTVPEIRVVDHLSPGQDAYEGPCSVKLSEKRIECDSAGVDAEKLPSSIAAMVARLADPSQMPLTPDVKAKLWKGVEAIADAEDAAAGKAPSKGPQAFEHYRKVWADMMSRAIVDQNDAVKSEKPNDWKSWKSALTNDGSGTENKKLASRADLVSEYFQTVDPDYKPWEHFKK